MSAGEAKAKLAVRAWVAGGAGFCVLTVGGISVLGVPGAVNVPVAGLILVVASVLFAAANRDVQRLLHR